MHDACVWDGVFKVCGLQGVEKRVDFLGRGEAKLGLRFICVYVVGIRARVNSMIMADWEILGLGFVNSMKIWAKRMGIGLAD